MPPSTFPNPISTSAELLTQYRELLRETLINNELSPQDASRVMEDMEVDKGVYVSLNRKFALSSAPFRQFCENHGLSENLPECFPRIKQLYSHQERAILSILERQTTILSTGTGSGKTETFLVPILDYCLTTPGQGVKALIVYPMNALAGDQMRRLKEATRDTDITFGMYVGSTPEKPRPWSQTEANTELIEPSANRISENHVEYRREMRQSPPNILITNYVMLDWMLTDPDTQGIFEKSVEKLRYVVLDELHSYRGSKAAHLKHLLARLGYILTEKTSITYIGTSATLASRAGGEGYLADDANERLANFVRPLLNVDQFVFVEPEYAPEHTTSVQTDQLHVPPDEALDWGISLEQETAWERLSQLLGATYNEWSLGDNPQISEPYCALLRHPIIQTIRSILLERPARLQDLAAIIGAHLDRPTEHSLAIVKAFLSATAFMNHASYEHPLLDFRVHLFLKNLSGNLKRCFQCNRYHSGRQEFCPDCGFPLFCVYREDVKRCIGKVSNKYLKWELRPQSDDQRNAYYVLIDLVSPNNDMPVDANGDTFLTFDIRQDADALTLLSSSGGRLRMQMLPVLSYAEVEAYLINLVDETHDHQYMLHLVRSLLSYQDRANKRILGFIDSRERASRFSSVLRDDFASAFLEAFARLHLPPGRALPLLPTLNYLRSNIPHPYLALEKELFSEFDLWFYRYISVPPRYGGAAYLQLKDGDWTAPERAILNVFLTERAIHKTFDNIGDSHFIRFQRYWASSKRAICSAGSQSSDPLRSTIVLSANKNAVYYPLVLEWGIRFALYWLESGPDEALSESDLESLKSVASYRETLAVALRRADQVLPFTGTLAAVLAEGSIKWLEEVGQRCIWSTIRDLQKRGIIIEDSDTNECYLLNSEYVNLMFDETLPSYEDYHALRTDLLLTAELHSSEVGTAERQRIEDGFNKGDIQFLMATPTLEMGIDIGELQNVLCFGVPPMPSNYAQRAGRAGRGRGSKYALIVTFCEENSNHDMYYFASPDKMIAGRITPPHFDPASPNIVKRHINAWLLADRAKHWPAIEDFCDQAEALYPQIEPILRALFPIQFDLRAYVTQDLPHQLKQIQITGQSSPRQTFYANGIFPDYSFRRDGVALYDKEEDADLRKQRSAVSPDLNRELSITERAPENACRVFAPDGAIYAGGDVYTVLSEGGYALRQPENGQEIREYEYFLGKKDRFFARKDKPLKSYALNQSFMADGTDLTPKVPMVVDRYYVPNCQLYLRNFGSRMPGGKTAPFRDMSNLTPSDERQETLSEFGLGYDLERHAIILSIDAGVCNDETYLYSLASALDRAMKDHFGLDEGELGLFIAIQPKLSPYPTHRAAAHMGGRSYIVFYDSDGNGNPPLEQIHERFDELVLAAYDRLTHCECRDGCYLCSKSYRTHFYANRVSKEIAKMFTGYLCGKTRFIPSMVMLPGPAGEIMDVEFSLHGEQLRGRVNGGKAFTSVLNANEAQNSAIFKFLMQLVDMHYTDTCRSLRLRTNLPYVIEAVNQGSLKSGLEAFIPFQFSLLRFSNVTAERL